MIACRVRRCRMAALGVALIAACGVSEDQEVAIGRQNAEQINARLPIVRDAVVGEYVQQLGLSMARTTSRADLDWRFFVVDSRDVNAFALPGGIIYVNRGLIERAAEVDELAGALGHEIAHVVLRHSVEQMKKAKGANVAVSLTCTLTRICDNSVAQAAIQVGGTALFAKYSREHESEADSVAVDLVIAAGIHPQGIPALFERLLAERRASPMAIEAFFASHPLEEDRIHETERLIAALDPRRLRGLARDVDSYGAFRARLAAVR